MSTKKKEEEMTIGTPETQDVAPAQDSFSEEQVIAQAEQPEPRESGTFKRSPERIAAARASEPTQEGASQSQHPRQILSYTGEGAPISREAAYFINLLPDDTYRVTFYQQVADAGVTPDAGILALLMSAIERRQLSEIQRSPYTMQAQEAIDQNPGSGAGWPAISPLQAQQMQMPHMKPITKMCEAQAPGCQGEFTPARDRAGQRLCSNPACWHAMAGLSPKGPQPPVAAPQPAIADISSIIAIAVQEALKQARMGIQE